MHWIDSNKMNGFWTESIFISCEKLINKKPKNTSKNYIVPNYLQEGVFKFVKMILSSFLINLGKWKYT